MYFLFIAVGFVVLLVVGGVASRYTRRIEADTYANPTNDDVSARQVRANVIQMMMTTNQ